MPYIEPEVIEQARQIDLFSKVEAQDFGSRTLCGSWLH